MMRTGALALLTAWTLLCAVGCGESEEVTVVRANLTYGNCPPFQDDQMCACTGFSGTGTCGVLTLGTRFFANLSTFPGLQALNDQISSFRVGPLVKAKICYDPGWGGSCGIVASNSTFNDLSITQGCPNGPFPDVGWGFACMNDTISSIRLDPASQDCSMPGPNQAAFFENSNFTGDCVVLDTGSYPHPNTNPTSGTTGGAFGLRTDSITSVKNGSNRSSNLYADPNFSPIGHVICRGCSSSQLGASINDKTSSIIVLGP